MTRYDQKILFTSLAFATVLIRDTNLSQSDNEDRVLRLASLFEDFCTQHIQPALSSNVPDGEKLDRQIEKHVKQLRDEESTMLPQDKDSLLQLYQRLRLRKIYRDGRGPLEKLNANKLADLVLAQLDEEIAYVKNHQ